MLVSIFHDVIANGKRIAQGAVAIVSDDTNRRNLPIVLFQQSDNFEQLELVHGNLSAGWDFWQFVGFDRHRGGWGEFVDVLHATHSIHFRIASRGLDRKLAWHTIWVGNRCKCLILKDLEHFGPPRRGAPNSFSFKGLGLLPFSASGCQGLQSRIVAVEVSGNMPLLSAADRKPLVGQEIERVLIQFTLNHLQTVFAIAESRKLASGELQTHVTILFLCLGLVWDT